MSRISVRQSSICASLFCAVLFLGSAPSINSQATQAENKAAPPSAAATTADTHPVLVELFTSEGCSSCPRADALLQKIDTLQPVAGAQLIVLSEHVDYWDHDGWKDPHSSSELTARQAAYVQQLGLKTPYTPQIIVDGSTEALANDPQQLDKVFTAAGTTAKVPVRINDVTFDAGSPGILHARIEADGTSDKHNADVFVAVALDHTDSQVLKGENKDRHLAHVAVVLEITKVGKLPKGKSFDQAVQLKLKPGTDPKNIRLVAFVQESGPGRLLGAALHKPVS